MIIIEIANSKENHILNFMVLFWKCFFFSGFIGSCFSKCSNMIKVTESDLKGTL